MELNKRHLIGIGIALSLIALNFAFVIIAMPILLIVWIDYTFCKGIKVKEKENIEIIEKERENIDSIRATVEKTEKEKEKWLEYRRNVDLRQFKGRNNVTVQEVEDYLWYHMQWEGHYEKEIILDEIKKVSNITDDDCRKIMYEHYHHKTNDGSIVSGCWLRNEEAKYEMEYRKQKVRNKEKEWNKVMNETKFNLLKDSVKENNDKHKYIFYYENWLKERGYKC